MRLDKVLIVNFILCCSTWCAETTKALSDEEIQQIKQILSKNEAPTKDALEKDKTKKDDNKNQKTLIQFMDKCSSEIGEDLTFSIDGIFAFQQKIDQIQRFLESFQKIYDFNIESINKLKEQYQSLTQELLYQTCVCHLFHIFITPIAPMLLSLDPVTTVTPECIDNILRLLSNAMQGMKSEIMTKPFSNIFSLLQSIKESTYPNWPSTIMFSLIKIFPSLLNDNLASMLNKLKASIEVVTLEIRAIIDEMAKENTLEKFSPDRTNITKCVIGAMQQFLQEFTETSNIVIDLLKQIEGDKAKIQQLCKAVPQQDITPFVGHED